ncbi:DUF805 domain-containing protein [Snodgrassella gandavensis]|uniref:DUF805 domain-containing protein n=1 Tax=Snodgrassella gandavensis TaxID=2946698 RepID=UPI001EF595D1|nr:DUF805 domain-containing protein [Snodgrassella gandavensis]
MIESYRRFWRNILNFSGTSNRADCWWPIVINNILGLVLIATLSLLFRRLHDTNRSAWWILIFLIPLIGQIWLIILTLLPSRPNRFQQGFF